MNNVEFQSDDAVGQIAELARQGLAKVEVLTLPKGALPAGLLVDEPTVLAITDKAGNVEIKSLKPWLDELRGKPAMRAGTATAGTLDSFIDLVRRHADRDSAIFVNADWRKPSMTAVIDYHLARPDPLASHGDIGDDRLARNGRHRVLYTFPLSESWKAWIANNGQAMSQSDFAAWIEDHIHEIASPDRESLQESRWEADFRMRFADPATLVDLARGLEVKVDSRVKSKVRLQSGETEMVFETEHKDAQGETLTVPGLFLVAVAPFYLGDPMRIPARLRYRVAGGTLVWSYDLFRPDEFITQRVRADVETVLSGTGLPVYDGAPEA